MNVAVTENQRVPEPIIIHNNTIITLSSRRINKPEPNKEKNSFSNGGNNLSENLSSTLHDHAISHVNLASVLKGYLSPTQEPPHQSCDRKAKTNFGKAVISYVTTLPIVQNTKKSLEINNQVEDLHET